MSSGSSREASAVEPTRSQNMTVTCRRSASGLAADLLASWAAASTAGTDCKAAIAADNRRRSPTNLTPRSFRSSAVRLGSRSAPILFARNAGSYCSSPSFRSHSATSMAASRHHGREAMGPPPRRLSSLPLCPHPGFGPRVFNRSGSSASGDRGELPPARRRCREQQGQQRSIDSGHLQRFRPQASLSAFPQQQRFVVRSRP